MITIEKEKIITRHMYKLISEATVSKSIEKIKLEVLGNAFATDLEKVNFCVEYYINIGLEILY